jgi:hypothetical protein
MIDVAAPSAPLTKMEESGQFQQKERTWVVGVKLMKAAHTIATGVAAMGISFDRDHSRSGVELDYCVRSSMR